MSDHGVFEGQVSALWLRDEGEPDRNMRLTEPFAYVEPQRLGGLRWAAPAGSVVNGASIPETFWSSVGPPFVGDYRRASVVHDVACEQLLRTSEEAHRMFYYAMRCDGVGFLKANTMYQAVLRFGPSWGAPGRASLWTPAEPSEEEAHALLEAVERACAASAADAEPEEVGRRVQEILGQSD